MTRPATAPRTPQPRTETLTSRIFRALYRDYDLHTLPGTHVAVPKGTPWFTGHSLSDIAQQISQYEHPVPDQPAPEAAPRARRPPLPRRPITAAPPASGFPHPGDVARITGFVHDHPSWSAFWDKQHGVWRVTEDDPDSGLYAASGDTGTVIRYMAEHVTPNLPSA
jgi:hypothetical protein